MMMIFFADRSSASTLIKHAKNLKQMNFIKNLHCYIFYQSLIWSFKAKSITIFYVFSIKNYLALVV